MDEKLGAAIPKLYNSGTKSVGVFDLFQLHFPHLSEKLLG